MSVNYVTPTRTSAKITNTYKKKKYVPVDLIIITVCMLIVLMYVVFYYFYDEVFALYNYSKTAVSNMRTKILRGMVNRKFLFLPIFNTKLYPPHYHVDLVHEKNNICFRNCYKNLIPVSTKEHIPSYSYTRNNFCSPASRLENWALDYALRKQFDDIFYSAIRNVSVSLLQECILWMERQVQRANKIKDKKKWLLMLNDKVQETFGAMFHTGNFILEDLNRLSANGIAPIQSKRYLAHLVPDDYCLGNAFQIQPKYPITVQANERRLLGLNLIDITVPSSDTNMSEKLIRVQIVLNWMIWKYVPDDYQGQCGKQLYEESRRIYEDFIRDLFPEDLTTMIVDYLFFSQNFD